MADNLNEFKLLRDLYVKHYQTVYRLACHLLRTAGHSVEDAADITQETFILAAQNIRALSAHPNPPGWLCASARNLCRNYARKQHTVLLGERDILIPNPQDDYALSDLVMTLEDSLSPEEMKLLNVYTFSGNSSRVAGQELGITAAAARKRMSRIRKKLQPILHLLVTILLIHYI